MSSGLYVTHSTHARDLMEILPVNVGTASFQSTSTDTYMSDVAWMAAMKALTLPGANSSWNSCCTIIRDTLHTVYEDCKLSTLAWNCLLPLGGLLHALNTASSNCVKDIVFSQHYASDLGLTCNNMQLSKALCSHGETVYHTNKMMRIGPNYPHYSTVPDVYRHFLDVIKCASSNCDDAFGMRARAISSFFTAFTQSGKLSHPIHQLPAQNLVIAMACARFGLDELESVPAGISLPLQDALDCCRGNPPDGWPAEAYRLVGRSDLALLVSFSHLGYQESCKIWADFKSVAFWRRTYSNLLFSETTELQTVDVGNNLPHDRDDGFSDCVLYPPPP